MFTLEELETERTELAPKINDLDAYIGSDPFRELNEVDQGLLIARRDAAKQYDSVIKQQVERLKRFENA